MALIDIFKKRKKEKPPEELKETAKVEKELSKKEAEPKKFQKRRRAQAYLLLEVPHITEKATELTKKDQYVFRVFKNSNKTEIKKAIENLYGVKVVNVRIINIPAKKRRLGKVEGWRKGYKKAIVRIKKGQKIEALPR